MLYEGVKSCSDRVHWIHWTRIDSIGDVDFLFIRDLEKCHHVVEGVESRSDGVHWIHWTRIDSSGDAHFLFVRDLGKCHHVVRGGKKLFRSSPLDPMDTNRFHRRC